MSQESSGERTEAPTQKKREDAFKKGQVPRSQEVTTAFLLIAAAGAIASGTGPAADAVIDIFGVSVQSLTALPVGPDGMAAQVTEATRKALMGITPILLTMAGVALLVAGVQARGALSVDPLKPKWDRMNPIKRIPQVWGWKAVAELGKSFMKFGVVALVIYNALDELATQLPVLGQLHPLAIMKLVHTTAVRLLLGAGLAYMVLGLADYAFQLWQHEKQLKMSREEIKRETKDAEGDQVLKIRRRTVARQMARRRMMLSVSEADVIVTNPTRIAVALKYDPAVADAPTVLAMGERKIALRIKDLAREHDIPVVENRPLAQALFATAKVGASIPMDLFVAVAEILAYVYRQAAMRPAGRAAWRGAEA